MGKGVKNLIGIVFGLAVFLGVGVVIGWFSKPAESIGEPEINRNPDLSIIDDFAKRVDSMKLRAESENLSKKIRYATGPVGLSSIIRSFSINPQAPVAQKVRMRRFFDASEVKESSFSKSDLTDSPSDF